MDIEEIYMKYRLYLFSIANKILNNHYLSEDAVQIAFTKIIKYYEKIKDKEEDEIKLYISIVVKNVAKTLYSMNQKEKIKIESIRILASNLYEENCIEDKTLLRMYVLEEINKLGDFEIYLINLKYNLDLKNRDIAKILDIDEKLVSKKIRKIEKKLKRRIENGR